MVIAVVDRKARPEVPARDQLPGNQLCLHDEYVELMQQCWAQDPALRPNFAAVISKLRYLPLTTSMRRPHQAWVPLL